ncbi:hypothetical protein ACFVW8_38620, partial [Streptomyces sp. NPDC058221]|uniref:hypothetical protein n=1 Tax=Streptomyces sp. NPDC058221 TaxID=3346388 RepID=UPI0036E4A3E1
MPTRQQTHRPHITHTTHTLQPKTLTLERIRRQINQPATIPRNETTPIDHRTTMNMNVSESLQQSQQLRA